MFINLKRQYPRIPPEVTPTSLCTEAQVFGFTDWTHDCIVTFNQFCYLLMYLYCFHIKWNLVTVQNLWIRNKKITNFMFGLAVCILTDMFKSSVKVSETLMVKADTSKMSLVFWKVFEVLWFTGHTMMHWMMCLFRKPFWLALCFNPS